MTHGGGGGAGWSSTSLGSARCRAGAGRRAGHPQRMERSSLCLQCGEWAWGTRQELRLEKRVRVPRPFQELGSHVLGSGSHGSFKQGPMCACLTSVSGWSLRNDWGEATNQKAAAFLQARQEGVPVRGDRAGGAEGRGQCCGLLGKQSPQNEMLRASLIGLVVQMDMRRTGWDLPTHEHGVAIHF